MLTPDEKQLMQRCLDAVRTGTPGFRTRRPQLQMIAAVAHALARVGSADEDRGQGEHLGVIEAGTGTGKTVGYLLPALVLAHMRGRKLIVSSSTVTLQEQLLHKDVPALLRHLPFPVSYAVAKGRRRFLCPARLASQVAGLECKGAELEPDPALGTHVQGAQPASTSEAHPPLRWFRSLSEAFDAQRWRGDRDAWPDVIPEAVWSSVTTDSQGCLGARCPSYERCPFYRARQQGQDADLVIANHDLVLAAAGMEAGSTLPDLREALVVFDEAHSLPGKVVEHCASRHSVCGASRWVAHAARDAQGAIDALRLDRVGAGLPQPGVSAQRLCALLEDLQDAVGRHCEFAGQQRISRFVGGVLPEEVARAGAAVLEAARAMEGDLSGVRAALVERAGEQAQAVQPFMAALGNHFAKLQQMLATWTWMLHDDAQQAQPVARWVERHASASGGDDFLVCAAPISGGPRLRELLWDQVGAAVLTSATLRACGRFDLFFEECGLAGFDALQPLALASPFDFAGRAVLHIPGVRAHPRDAAAHGQEIVRRLPALLERQRGSLVLFASARQMREVHAALPAALREAVLMQGQCSRRELIERHRARIDGGQRSVLFGLASLAEGVDLPGEYCTHVICAKLPFSVPDSPLEQARREWIEAQGRSAFLERSVPEVGIRLAQATGRLLRTDEDRGTVTVLDPRLGGTRWGRMLLEGLPPFRVVIGDRDAHPAAVADAAAAA
ncbi:helicase c2 [Delftia sp. Cs1-4]|uniref:ATP-dependent DNA helicase DinG n=1 Tax=Delftia sp. (strain Cs1-4) TaxID=742013 RepID=UPI00020E7BCE|nr:ATP-dependent DNA helicase DinG [Delftia sp. Cs1-4]AEF88797.1 helicase c2 [Delftia sp. Cs1-4]